MDKDTFETKRAEILAKIRRATYPVLEISAFATGHPLIEMDLSSPQELTSGQIANKLAPFISLYQKYYFPRMIGKAGCGTMYAGYQFVDNKPVALKVERFSDNKMATVEPEEVILQRKAAEKNAGVMQVLEWKTSRDQYTIVLERFEPCKTLWDYGKDYISTGIPEPIAWKIFRQLAIGLNKCHRNGIIHSDVKLENILINPDTLDAKWINFGDAINIEATPLMGDQLQREEVWSLGFVLFRMLNSLISYDRCICDGVLVTGICYHKKIELLNVSDSCKNFLSKILDESYSVTMGEVLHNLWVLNGPDGALSVPVAA